MTPTPNYFDPSKFKAGVEVRVASRGALEHFVNTCTYHHKLHPDQLVYAGRTGKVLRPMMYHGGDMLYELEGIPGIWHEQCLEAV